MEPSMKKVESVWAEAAKVQQSASAAAVRNVLAFMS
jgi:hypothetical protein